MVIGVGIASGGGGGCRVQNALTVMEIGDDRVRSRRVRSPPLGQLVGIGLLSGRRPDEPLIVGLFELEFSARLNSRHGRARRILDAQRGRVEGDGLF